MHDTGQLIRWKAELVCEVVSPSFAALPLSVIQSGLVLESGDVFEEKSILYRVRDRLAHLLRKRIPRELLGEAEYREQERERVTRAVNLIIGDPLAYLGIFFGSTTSVLHSIRT